MLSGFPRILDVTGLCKDLGVGTWGGDSAYSLHLHPMPGEAQGVPPPPSKALIRPSGEDAMGRSCILDSPRGRGMPAAVQMPAAVRMPPCHGRRFKGERPIGAATGQQSQPPRPCANPPPPPKTKRTIVGKTEIYRRENLIQPFLVHKLLGPRPPAPSDTSLIYSPPPQPWGTRPACMEHGRRLIRCAPAPRVEARHSMPQHYGCGPVGGVFKRPAACRDWPLASAGSGSIRWSRGLLGHAPDAARSY